ncbi:PspA/IM30 family protein [Paenibacillus faecalis]|uniref:PspA/IM30 family protein n=1 Tax=Paenibacillus faecalis TaxID=2079532 RepID=UPI000D101C69|nr:PspA/IM30 family protein [Paenibacillus faecalis]
MGILSRFKDIMESNVNVLLDKMEEPEKVIDEYIQRLHQDLGKVKAETASVFADERRAKRALDECKTEIKKLHRYVEKAVKAGHEENALKFLERKAMQSEKLGELQGVYDLASSKAESMKQMQDKLISDIGQLEARHTELKGKMAATKIQENVNSERSSLSKVHFAVKEMEEKANFALDEAMALAELRAEAKKDDLDDLIAQLEQDAVVNAHAEDELNAMKAKMKTKE